jgi:hypothetical protein
MAGAGDRLLGLALWHGARWYARRRLRRARRVLLLARLAVPVLVAVLAAARAIVRRRVSGGLPPSGRGGTFVA